MLDGSGKTSEAVEIDDLGLNSRPVGLRKGRRRLLISPFLGGFVQCFVILVKFFFQGCRWFLLAQLCLEPVRD